MTGAVLRRPAQLPVGNVAGLTRLDVATGGCNGTEPRVPLPRLPRDTSVVDAMRDVLRPALARGRCHVAFSGGRDSYWTLALATELARLEGYDLPIPVTLRFPDVVHAKETGWQERTVDHLGLEEWKVREITDELEIIGPYAQRALRMHGLLFPSNAYLTSPLLEMAAGNDLVLGVGGSDFYMFWRFGQLSDLVARRRRPRRSDVAIAVWGALPKPARIAVARREMRRQSLPWLRPAAVEELLRIRGHQLGQVPRRYDAALRQQRTHRCYAGTARSMQALATGHEARLITPMTDPRVMAAGAAWGGATGRGGRTGLVLSTVSHLLPPEVLRRQGSTSMQGVLFRSRVPAFAASWSGHGLDTSLVDPDALRAVWRSGRHDWRTCALMQLAWLHDDQADRKKTMASAVASADGQH